MKQVNQISPPLALSFAHDNAWHTVAIPVGVDPAAKLVTVEIYVIDPQTVGARPVGCTAPADQMIWPAQSFSLSTVTIPVVSSAIQLRTNGTYSTFRIVAEWGGNLVKTNGDLTRATGWNTLNTGTYRDVDLSSFFGADAGNVEAVICYNRRSNQATPDTEYDTADVRPEGSTYNGIDPGTVVWNSGQVVKIVNPTNIVEVRESGYSKTPPPLPQNSWVYFAGYILKGIADDGTGLRCRYVGASDPSLDGVGSDAWEQYDPRAKTSARVFSIVWRLLRIGSSYHEHYARKIGSGANVLYQGGQRPYSQFVLEVDENFEVEEWLEHGAGGTYTESRVWGWLEAQPAQATSPDPANGATGIELGKLLTWTAGLRAESHDVYFGTSPALGVGDFQGNQPGASFDPGELDPDVVYYWRIDEVNDVGTTAGVVWSFTTRSPVCLHAAPTVRPRVLASSAVRARIGAETGVRERVLASPGIRERVKGEPGVRGRVSARIWICEGEFDMRATPLCPTEIDWNADSVVELTDVEDDLSGTATPITSADSVTCEIYDVETGDELSIVSPVTLNQVGSENKWRNTVLFNAANGFSERQRLRFDFIFDGGVGLQGFFQALGVVASATE